VCFWHSPEQQQQPLLSFSLQTGTLCNLKSWQFESLLQRPKWLVIRPEHYSSIITTVYLLTKFPPGFFRYWQGPADMVWAAASSCVSPCSNLHLLPSWELSDIVCIHLQTRMLFSVDQVFLKRAGRRDVISAALRACLDPHTPTPSSALGNDTYSPSIYFLLVVLSLWLN